MTIKTDAVVIGAGPVGLFSVFELGILGFSPDSIVNRILDCKSEFVITADEGLRGQKVIPLKKNIDEALKKMS